MGTDQSIMTDGLSVQLIKGDDANLLDSNGDPVENPPWVSLTDNQTDSPSNSPHQEGGSYE